MGCRALCLILLCGLIGSYAQPQCALITPNVLRVDSEETIIVDGHDSAFDADIIIQDYPQKSFSLVQGKVSVNKDNGFLGTTKLTIPANNLRIHPNKKQYVYVTVKSASYELEKVILLSFQSGYIFIQTDKPIYTPGSTVLYRIFTMNPSLQPVYKPVIIEFLNPENGIVKQDLIEQLNTGIISLSHKLSELVSLGAWTISAKFKDADTHNYTTHFEVKEYVPPSFEVKLSSDQSFFYLKDQELRVDISAKYLYGKPVDGKAFITFGVKRDGEKQRLPDTLRRVQISEGEGTAVLERIDLEKYFREERDMLQWSIYVSVTVIADSGSDMVEAKLENIYIVTSRYIILFTKTSKYFKPGMPFHLMVFVTNPDGSPAARVPVSAIPGSETGITDEDGIIRLTLHAPSDISSLQITVTTMDPKLSNDQQASAIMEASAYKSIGGNYLHISIAGGVLKPGENAVFTFIIQTNNPTVQNQISHINYVILNKGRVMKVGRKEKIQGQILMTLLLPISAEFMPSFRVVAYYMVTTDAQPEIVADSVWVDVADYCMGTLQVTGSKDSDNAVQRPGSLMRLKVRADHKASVGLVAVDKSVYLHNNKFKITQSKVWDSVDKYDIGCTPGSGANTPGVFYDAGLALQTSFQMTTPQRSEPLCQVKLKRRRRATSAFSQHEDYIGDDDSDNIEDYDIISRAQFPESWLWKIELMNEKPDAHGISTKTLGVFLKDTITTWEVLAVSLSENKGICVSRPYDIRVMKDFFIDLQLPYSVVRNEQVEIRAALYNYGNSKIKVRVNWTYNAEFCSPSTAEKKYHQVVTINSASSAFVPFIIVPITLGYHVVEVKAAVEFTFISDGVKKKLKVVPEGRRLTQTLKSVTLEPEIKGKAGIQEEIISKVDANIVVPKTDVVTIVTIKGSPISNGAMEKPIDGVNLNYLISGSSGNGEENLITMTHPVIASHYLDSTGQWEKVGVQQREQAIQFIRNGLIRQMEFRKSDSSYGAGTTTPSSTWLTAYAVKVFTLAESLVKVERTVLCDSVNWLILEKQKPDGLFQEHDHVYHQEMVGGIVNSNTEFDSTLTAFILIAMLESEELCTGHVANLRESIDRAASFINMKYSSLNNPYSIAITSYALARAGNLQDTTKLMSASTGNSHWVEPVSDLSLEATSYALLTLLKTKQFEQTGPIVQWLKGQTFSGDISRSTQATIIMLQALAQYQIDILSPRDLDMYVTIYFPGRIHPRVYRIGLQNATVEYSEQTSVIEDILVTAKGKGQVTLTAFSVYNTIETEKKKCNNFNLSVTIKNEPLAKRPEGAKSTVSITICTRFLKAQDALMSVFEISLMTGYSPDIDDLNKLKRGVDRYISEFTINTGTFDQGTLFLYVKEISHTEENCLKFNLHQYFAVGRIQPASVTVYEYYSPENRCTKLYHVEEGSKLLETICQGGDCQCVEESCFLQQQLQGFDVHARIEKACGVDVDYVFKVTLTAIKHSDNYDTYVMTIQNVIKEGTDIAFPNKKRNFISHVKCQKALQLQIGRDYLISGVSKDLWNMGSEFSYLITKDTWIEMWPNNSECRSPQYEQLCEELFQFLEEMEIFGCRI
ncbi:A.superbus venom factor 1-like [Mixophyes fleayi]|uniref:A.superbus venom factor 1-like n=1 Tax=Mixophyes fleayi TaxID=3061075 RepID=UPI003F4E4219